MDDVCDWLEDNGYPETTQQSFRGIYSTAVSCTKNYYLYIGVQRLIVLSCLTEQEMDGNAINFGLASAPGPDWLKDVVPTLGLRLKVHNSLRALCSTNQVGSIKTDFVMCNIA